MSWFARSLEAVRGLVFRARADAETEEELRFHVDMEAQRLVREQGLDPHSARRQAAIAFGGVEKHREEVRDARGLAWLGGMSLDFRLGGRMLVRYWGLTLVGGLGMALAIALGAVFHAVTRVVDLPLPLADGSRIVALENWDSESSTQERRIIQDFVRWRDGMRSVEDLAAYRTVSRNLIDADGATEPVALAAMTASGFRVARVPALLGRTLIGEDETEGAQPVVVLGYDVWQTRYAADPDILGRDIRLGDAVHTVVGVMPDGFAFPRNHRLWIPLRADASAYERRQGPAIHVFGRLAGGATFEGAQAELATLGQQLAATHPDTHARLRPRLVPYTAQILPDEMRGWEIPLLHLMLVLLLVVVCANIAILIYARTVTRAGEIAVRSALGASDRRIVGQLFVEALVLAGVAALVGLLAAHLALGYLNGLLDAPGGPDGSGGIPFWVQFRLSPATMFYVLGLTVLSAAVAGVVPAFRAAGSSVQAALRQLSGGGGMQLGRTWTALIVVQVAVTVALLPAAVSAGWKLMQHAGADPGISAGAFLVGPLVLDRDAAAGPDGDERAFEARYAGLQAALARRLEVEPGVAGVTFAVDLPGQERTVRVEVSAASTHPDGGHAVRIGRVGRAFFDTFDLPILSGRNFHVADVRADAAVVIVSRSLAEQVAGDAGALGRRIRYVEGYRSGGRVHMPAGVEPDRWYEVVGVVPDFPNRVDPDDVTARVYHVLAPGQAHPVNLAVRAGTVAPAVLAARLRQITAAVDPALQLRDVRPLDAVLRDEQTAMRAAAVAIGLVMLSVLLLSAAGIYALMSFTVARRRREIGIRAALGADPQRLLRGIFSRSLRQLSSGVVVGLSVVMLLEVATAGGVLDGRGSVLLPVVAALMLTVGLLAALGPARRGLRIQPTEALRED